MCPAFDSGINAIFGLSLLVLCYGAGGFAQEYSSFSSSLKNQDLI